MSHDFASLSLLIQHHCKTKERLRWCPEIEERLNQPRASWMTLERAQEDLNEALAWSFEDPRLMRALLKAGARPDRIHLLQTLNGYDRWPKECKDELLTTVGLMIKAGADAKVVRRLSGDYYPKQAVSLLEDVFGRRESWAEPLARLLLENGAPVDAVDGEEPPVLAAIKMEAAWPFALLLEHGVDTSVVGARDWESASSSVMAWRRAQSLEASLDAKAAMPSAPKPRM